MMPPAKKEVPTRNITEKKYLAAPGFDPGTSGL
jgi:hypothetical protein